MPPEDTGQGDPNIARDWVVTLERWGSGYGQEREVSPSSQALVETVRAVAGERSAILAIGVGGEAVEETDWWLGVNASDGLFSVSAQLGEGVALDFVGDPSATGTVPFVLGGQTTPYPRRYLVSLQEALDAALEFFHTGTVDVESRRWDRQGHGDACEQEGVTGESYS